MSKLSDFVVSGYGVSQLIAGAAFNADASGNLPLAQTGPDGRAYPVVVSDCAAVSSPGQIVAQTSIVSGVIGGGNSNAVNTQGVAPIPGIRNVIGASADGALFILGPNNSGGAAVYKYSASGTLLGSLALDTSANSLNLQAMAQLSNGNFAAAWTTTATGNILTYAVFTPNLTLVAGPTAIEGTVGIAGGSNMVIISLSGGGFAMSWATVSATRTRIAIYSNAGAAVSAPADIKTANAVYDIKLAQLPNGNIVYAHYQASAGGGMQFAIYSPLGAVVQALSAATGASTGTLYQCLLSVMPTGFFAIAFANSAGYLCANVYSSAGVQQGATFTPQTTYAMQAWENLLLNDGSVFWLFADAFSGGIRLSNIQTSGSVGTVNNVQISPSGNNAWVYSGFIENGFLVAIRGSNGGPYQNYVYVINLNAATLSVTPTAIGVAASTYASSNPNIISGGGDFSYIALYDYQSPSGTLFYVGKYANTSIIGPANAVTAAGARVAISPYGQGGAGSSVVTSAIAGTSPKQFDHSAAAIYGQKGTLLTNGAVLKGI
jgi:hypothetical protein